MLFMLYDDHHRNFLESKALLNLMETIEKLFSKEKQTLDFNNVSLTQNNAKYRAICNFKFIKVMIDH